MEAAKCLALDGARSLVERSYRSQTESLRNSLQAFFDCSLCT